MYTRPGRCTKTQCIVGTQKLTWRLRVLLSSGSVFFSKRRLIINGRGGDLNGTVWVRSKSAEFSAFSVTFTVVCDSKGVPTRISEKKTDRHEQNTRTLCIHRDCLADQTEDVIKQTQSRRKSGPIVTTRPFPGRRRVGRLHPHFILRELGGRKTVNRTSLSDCGG